MRLSGIHAGDLVAVDKRGREFLALVETIDPRELRITPLKGTGVNYRTATAREVVAHFKRRGTVPRNVLVGDAS